LTEQYETIATSVDGAVATLTLDRPEKLNAINPQMRADLTAALEQFEPGADVRVVRIRANGRAFSSGFDLDKGLHGGDVVGDTRYAEGSTLGDIRDLRAVGEWLRAIRRYRKPVVAQVHGMCLAGGMDLMGACDIVIASDDCRIGNPGARGLGNPMTLGFMPIRVGAHRAKELLFTGDTIDGAQAERWGLVNTAVPAEELEEVAAFACRRISGMPLDMLTINKMMVNRWIDAMGLDAIIDAGIESNAFSHTTPFYAEFRRRADSDGLKAALDWRDAPYRALD